MPTKWFHSGRVFLKINTILKTYITWKAHSSFVLVDMGLFQIFLLESCGQQLVTTWQPGPWPVTAALQQRAQDVPQHHIRLQMARKAMKVMSIDVQSLVATNHRNYWLTKWHHQLRPRWPCHHSNSLRRTSQLFAILVKDPATARPGWAMKWDHLPG